MRKKTILSALQSGAKTPVELYDLCRCDPYDFARTLTELSDSEKIERRIIIPNHDTVYRSITLVPAELIQNIPYTAIRVEYRLTNKTY
jgi:hypothetical protein